MEEKNSPVFMDSESDISTERVKTEGIRQYPRRKKTWFGRFLIALMLLFTAAASLYYVNEFSLQVLLAGEPEIVVEYGDDYQEPGAGAFLVGKWLFRSGIPLDRLPVQTRSDLQPDIVGKYTMEYSVDFYGWKASAQRTVRIVDVIAPVIILQDTNKTILPGERYVEEGFIAMDNYDGNVTDKVRSVEGLDTITYTVVDSSGNPASAVRKIPYFDPKAPVLELKGKEFLSINCGTLYTEPGYTAKDNVDGDLTEDVAVEGKVIWYEPGTYQVVYTVADAFGNVTQKVRTVEVNAVPRPEIVNPRSKTIYLTFDDGPDAYTMTLLDLLDYYGVKATFFVTGSGSNGELWRMHKAGHSIGIHTLSHDYDAIYSSEEAYFEDLNAVQDIIYRETGERTTLVRFPGGGSNLASNFNKGIMTRLAEAVQNAGYQYFDWNVDSNDAGGARTAEQVAQNVIEGVKKQRVSVVLQHDIHGFSVQAVEEIILWGMENGYQFLPLTPDSPPMRHDILN